ncbi:M28 family metallopeptidase [Hyphobacterium marinum]|uniref:M28 family metallopeptidase n=1 Tax=Hyphobacterium marinum TaxID=3116574 RepID=A0ABU7LYY8_9PROT|nr:M28 family metallopeptidase [Hyphobacterium sp. Y6023]MEE2566748.1 M28 family metallopeptidase [Hyphobacterium sp. Y6023]
MKHLWLISVTGLLAAACSQPADDTAASDPARETALAGTGGDDVASGDMVESAAADGSCAALYANSGSDNPTVPFTGESLANSDTSRPPVCDTSTGITGSDMAWRIQTLASDEFEGRAPALPGGIAASQWIADEMEAAGLEPAGEDGTYFQPVPLVEATLDEPASSMDISINGEPMGLAMGSEYVIGTRTLEDVIDLAGTDVVFVGYGVVAPEYGWDDYAGLDVEGRTVLILVNDPGFETEDPDLFNGRAMTYYGRWTYKYEEAARQGAAAAIVIHETDPASYGWNVVQNSWSGPQFDLQRPEGAVQFSPVEGWINNDRARELLSAVGYDYDELKTRAQTPGFTPIELDGVTLDAHLETSVRQMDSRNVAGVVRGSERPDEYVLYMAHWDHIGSRPAFEGQDGIYNGAVDNGTGTSALLEIAQRFASGDAPERSALFVAVTAEESGLLGSAYFAVDPLVPLNQIVAGINMDGMLPVGATSNVVVVGYGASEVEEFLAEAAAEQDRTLSPDPNPEAGYFYRSDHISLAKLGVPMLYADGGSISIEHGEAYGEEMQAAYRARAYHAPDDEFSHDWDFDGLARDVTLMANTGWRILNSEDWPNWYEGNEFRGLRDAMMEDSGE